MKGQWYGILICWIGLVPCVLSQEGGFPPSPKAGQPGSTPAWKGPEVIPTPEGVFPLTNGGGELFGNPVPAHAETGPGPLAVVSGSFLYARGEYLLWWIKDSHIPPLVTTGPDRPDQRGILGQPETVILFGGEDVNNKDRSGGRFTLGIWMDNEHTAALEGNFFFLGQRTIGAGFDSTTIPVLSRPFFNVNTGQENALVVAAPDLLTGRVNIEAPSRLWGAEGNLRYNLSRSFQSRLDLVAGLRYLELKEGLQIVDASQALTDIYVDNQLIAPRNTLFTASDGFQTRNQFWGGQVGAVGKLQWGAWHVEGRAKVALGSTHQAVTIQGYQIIQEPGQLAAAWPGGLLALPTNIGQHSNNRFAVVPEVGVNLGYLVADWWRVFVGYDFLVLSSVIRPGDQIDPNINVSFIPNSHSNVPPSTLLRPAPTLRDTTFWAQGISIGMEIRY